MNMLVERVLVERALMERDRREAETEAALAAGAGAVIRLSARMPSGMRRLGLASNPVARGAAIFECACRDRGLSLRPLGSGDGPLGPWRLWASGSRPDELKRTALQVEEDSWLGSLLDLDVIGPEGPVGRAELCLPSRRCVVCGGTAAECSGRATHDPKTVEAAFGIILERSRSAVTSGSPDGDAVGVLPPLHIEEIETKGGDTP
ncbi:MAG: hypothetical protein CVV51_09075 [Spirochaetae bacterium HGW-Spirochaetae-7]|nr:MAG: hypothetical protein CVV51_09075 [Spirochaetae bacterium HGW-Spirochaetae-7]